MRTRGWMVLGGLTVLLAGTGSGEARAQDAQGLGPDSLLVVVPIRDTVEIQRELGAALQAKAQADNDRARAERLRSSARVRITRKSGEIDAVKDRLKTAKGEKRAAEVVALEAEKKATEREKDLIERRESLRDAEIDLEKKRGELADARRQALELELQLAVRRLDQERAGNPRGPEGARTAQVLNDIEKRTLEVQQKVVETSKDVGDRQKGIIQQRLQILEAQRKFITGA